MLRAMFFPTTLAAGLFLAMQAILCHAGEPDRSAAQKAAATQAAVKLQLAQNELDEVTAKLNKARQAEKEAVTAAQDAADRVDRLGKKIEAAQPDSSRFARARTAYAAVKAEYAAAVDRVVASPEYKKAREKVVAGQSAAISPQEQKKWLDSDGAADAVFEKYVRCKTEYESAQKEILSGNLLWKDASDELRQAEARRDSAQAAVQSAASARMALKAIVVQAMNELTSAPAAPGPAVEKKGR